MNFRRSFAGSILFAVLFCSTSVHVHSHTVASPNAFFCSGSETPADLLHGLIMHLTFDNDESGRSTVTDASGNGNHGKPVGVHWTPQGKRGGAYEFRTDGDAIVVPNNPSLNPAHFTLSVWIRTSCRDTIWRRIFDKSYSQGYALSIAAPYNGNAWSGLASLEVGPGMHFALTRTVVADGAWHHVVATFDGSEQILYVDGRPEGRPLQWDTVGRAGQTTCDLTIGSNGSNVGEPDFGTSFHGTIDEPMLWNRALSVSEVARLYESQK